MTMQLYGGKMGSSLRCHWMLKELGYEYEQVSLNMQEGEHKSPAYLALNPAGQVPTLVHDGFTLAESYAINNYLIDISGSDLGGNNAKERSKVHQWSMWAITSLQPYLSTLASPSWTGKHDEIAEAKASEILAERLPILNSHLASAPYLAGERFTVADINVGAMMTYADLAQYDLSPYAYIVAWRSRITERPAYKELIAK